MIKWLFFDLGSTLIDETECEKARARALPEKLAWPCQLEKLYPGAAEILAGLSGKYRLGIIANQLPGARERMEGFGILKFFEVIVTSAEAGVAKPDVKIFRRALEMAGCAPEEAVMIGDRLDNDIFPAAALGMGAIWVRQGKHGAAVCENVPGIAVESLNCVDKFL